MQNKVRDIKDIPRDGKIVLCQGCFDLVHPGHVKHLEAAKRFGDILVVAVTSDQHVNKGPNRPYFPQELRMEQLAALEVVDYVVLSDSPTAIKVIEELRPDFFAKGSEYRDKEDVTGNIHRERQAVEALGGLLVFTDEATFSSSTLLNTGLGGRSEELTDAIEAYGITQKKVDVLLDKIKDLKVLVIGETIVDHYVHTNPSGMPSKNTVVCVRHSHEEKHLGGAYATARHMSQFCNDVTLLTCMSRATHKWAVDQHDDVKIIPIPIDDEETILKTRWLDDKGSVLFRVDHGNDEHMVFDLEGYIVEHYDLVVVNDFGHGMISKATAKKLADMFRQKLAVNTQSNSMNRGFNLITKYPGAGYISIDLPEARLAAHMQYGEADDLADYIMDRMVVKRMLSITHGKYGSYVTNPLSSSFIPALVTKVVDATGAGDAYFAITSLLSAITNDTAMVGFIGNGVGAMATQVLGNQKSVDAVALQKFLATILR